MMTLKIKKSSFHIWIFILQLLLRNGFFDIFAINDPLVGSIRLRDVAFIAALAWTLFVEIIYKGWKIRTTFSGLIRSFLCIIIFNCFVSNYIFGQPVTLGFQAQRDVFAGLSMFLALNTLVYRGRITKNELLRVLFWFGIIQLVLNTFHWVLYTAGRVSLFDGANVFTSRYGGARIIFSQDDTIAFVMAIAMNEIMNKGKHAIRNYSLLVWGFAYYMIMEKHRAETVAVFLALAFTLMLWRKASLKKIAFSILLVIVSVFAYDRIPILQDVVQTIFKDNSTSANTMIIRQAARLYYFQRFLESPLFGWGYPHANWTSAFSGQGTAFGYVFSDNGVFSFLYIYGALGLIWLLVFMFIYYKQANEMLKRNCYTFTMWGAFQAIMLITGMFWIIKNNQLSFVTALVLATNYNKKEAVEEGQNSLQLKA